MEIDNINKLLDQTRGKSTRLIHAYELDKIEICIMLIENGENIYEKDDNETTIFHIVTNNELLKILLDMNKNNTNNNDIINLLNKDGLNFVYNKTYENIKIIKNYFTYEELRHLLNYTTSTYNYFTHKLVKYDGKKLDDINDILSYCDDINKTLLYIHKFGNASNFDKDDNINILNIFIKNGADINYTVHDKNEHLFCTYNFLVHIKTDTQNILLCSYENLVYNKTNIDYIKYLIDINIDMYSPINFLNTRTNTYVKMNFIEMLESDLVTQRYRNMIQINKYLLEHINNIKSSSKSANKR